MRRNISWMQVNVFCLIIFVGIIISPAIANYQSKEGRWMQQDPMQYVDGLNFYEYVASNPLIFIDPGGRWKSGTHKSITTEAFDQAFPNTKGKCKKQVVDKIIEGNLYQDSDNVAFGENERHYNRDLGQNVLDANLSYIAYIVSEMMQYHSLINSIVSSTQTSDSELCGEILLTIGRLTHSWEDYYAHAVLQNGQAGPAWAANPPITGSPDNLDPRLIPSSWGDIWNPGEHRWSEPADRDKPGGRQARYNDARDYVANKLKELVESWYVRCGCCSFTK